MTQRQRRRMLPILAGLFLAALGVPARADDAKPAGSLAWIPADASYYSAMLRNKEQIDALTKSKAWAALRELPAVQMAWQAVQTQYSAPEGQLAPLRAFLDQPENQELVTLLGDAVSHEVFVYGGASWVPFMELMALLNNAQRYGPLMILLDKGREADTTQMQARSLMRALAAHPELIQVPDLVLGFKVSDTKRADGQLKRLEALAGAVAEHPALKGRFKTVKVGESRFLTFSADGSMVPWDQIPLKDFEEKEGEFAALVKKLKELQLTVSVGLKGDYLLVALGSSVEVVNQLEGKGKRLVDTPAFKPLRAAADKRLTSVGYVSPALRAEQGMSRRDMDNLLQAARQALAAADIPEAKRKQITKDLDGLSRELLKDLPEFGAEVSFSYMTDRGYESYEYDYTKDSDRDGSKPLTLLHHLGGNPLLAAVGRQKTSPEGYQTFVKWLKVFYGHAEDVVVGKLEKEQRELYEKYAKAILPLLTRLDEITGKMLLPALADGQSGFVLDGKWSSKQWFAGMPALGAAMPLPEPAIVLGVSDAALLRKAMGEYRKLMNDAIVKARELDDSGKIPDFQLPAPETKDGKGMSLFSYLLPAAWGVDAQVVPTAGLSDKVAVLTLSHAAAERLLARKPLKVQGGPLADLDKPRAAAAYLDWPAMVDLLTPWVELGVTASGLERMLPGAADEEGARKAKAEILKQVRVVLRVLKAYRGSTSSTYLEGGAWVTHGETVIRDLGD